MFKKIIKTKALLIKLFNWEYWPTYIVYFPLSIYYLYLAAKAKSFFFFSASNPSIETGGMFFESKWKIFKLIPKEYYPTTIFISERNPIAQTLAAIDGANITYPFIAKPDRGERGWAVQKINNHDELIYYIANNRVDFLIQKFIDFPIELSVFYYRNPRIANGVVSSVTFKELLNVVGDGQTTLRSLIMQNPRALLQFDVLEKIYVTEMDIILKDGEKKVLVPYGNHCRGAMFLDYNHIIDEQLNDTFDQISKSIKGFYYGRYDIKCNSIEELKLGINFSIVELNGAGAEPAHIYQPNYSFFKAQRDIFKHYSMLCAISMENAKTGTEYLTFKSFRAMQAEQKIYKSKVNVL
jgi:hypothetical protein